MTNKQKSVLTEAEFRMMTALWQIGSGTVHDIINVLPEDPKPAYTTVLTNMQILTRKGMVRHEAEGRKHHYYPLIEKSEARRNAAKEFVDRFFGGSKQQLMHSLFAEDDLDAETLKRLTELIGETKDY